MEKIKSETIIKAADFKDYYVELKPELGFGKKRRLDPTIGITLGPNFLGLKVKDGNGRIIGIISDVRIDATKERMESIVVKSKT
jgi:hypothetical protein